MEEQHPDEVPGDADLEIQESPEELQARRLVRLSWWMLPLLVISTLVAVAFAVLVSWAADFDPIDPLGDQGVLGWVVFIVANLVLWPLPSYLGVRFALQARRLGANAFVPLVAHCFVLAVIWSLALLSILSEF